MTVSTDSSVVSGTSRRDLSRAMGLTAGLLFYVFPNSRWTLTEGVSDFLVEE